MRPCRAGGCPNETKEGFCEAHTFREGDFVRFERTHYLHNQRLKSYQGEVGVVEHVDVNRKCCVQFSDLQDSTYWISSSYLELAETRYKSA